MALGLNPLRFLGAVTAQVGPVYKGLMQKGLGAVVRLGAGSYTLAPDNATPLPLIGNAALDCVPAISPLSTTAQVEVGAVQVAGPLIQTVSAVAAAGTDVDFVVFGLTVTG